MLSWQNRCVDACGVSYAWLCSSLNKEIHNSLQVAVARRLQLVCFLCLNGQLACDAELRAGTVLHSRALQPFLRFHAGIRDVQLNFLV
jgi:hypothetical protein